MNNRLQFIHHNEIFSGATTADARKEAIDFLTNQYFRNVARPSLYGEPLVVRYESKETPNEPNVILAIGSTGSGSTLPTKDSEYFLIDAQGIKDDVSEKYADVQKSLARLAYSVLDSDTLRFTKVDSESGSTISGNVKVAEETVINREVKSNIIKTGKDGIYSYVDVKFDDKTNTFTFQINDSVTKASIPVVESGKYDISKEAIVLTYTDGSVKEIDVDDLIGEWTTEGDASDTPIVLTKERHSDKDTDIDNRGDDKWRDVLKADVRVSDKRDNILEKTNDGKELYVRGTADNIDYDGKKTVKEAIDGISKVGVSSGVTKNIIFRDYASDGQYDGIGANVGLDYDNKTNVLTFSYSDINGVMHSEAHKLNSAAFIDDVSYDTVNQKVIIRYKDESGTVRKTEIDLSTLLDDWDVVSEGHNVRLYKQRNAGKEDTLSADLKIKEKTDGNYQILEDNGHELYVKGSADNIHYNGSESVEAALDRIDKEAADESSARKSKDDELTLSATTIINTIGSGFSDSKDAKMTITDFKASVDASASTIDSHVSDVEAKSDENAEKIKALSGESYFEVADTDSVSMKKGADSAHTVTASLRTPVSSDGKPNAMVIDNDGAHVSISYDADTNELIVSDNNVSDSKERRIQLNSISIIEAVRYDKASETIVITYRVGKGEELKRVEVPARDIIDEWNVDSSWSDIALTKKRNVGDGVDVLSAKAVLCTTGNYTDNVMRSISGGGLYVSGNEIRVSATSIANDAASKATESAVGSAAEYTDAKFNEERKARISEDSALGGRIDGEISDRVSGDTTLDNRIKAEEAARTAKDDELNTKITNEISNRTTADGVLQSNIDAEAANRKAADNRIDNSIQSETTSRENADSVLDNKIADESKARQDAVSELTKSVSDNLDKAKRFASDSDADLKEELKQDASSKDSALKTEIVRIINEKADSVTLNGRSTNTAKVEVKDNGIYANVSIASGSNNLKANAEGLYVGDISASYDMATNMLTIRGINGSSVLSTRLNSASFLDKAEYDKESHNLIITYHVNGSDESKQLVIPLDGLVMDVIEGNSSFSPISINVTPVKAEDNNGIAANKISADIAVGDNVSGNILKVVSTGGKGAALIADASGIMSLINNLQSGVTEVKLTGTTDSDTVTLNTQIETATGKQLLKADVKISDNSDNLLSVNNIDGEEGLYFDGSVDYGVMEGDDNIN